MVERRVPINLAVAAAALQSSFSEYSTTNDPLGAISGHKSGGYGFHTEFQSNPWWMLDLGRACEIVSVVVYNRGDAAYHRIRNSIISVCEAAGQPWSVVYQAENVFGGVNDDRPLRLTFAPVSKRARFLKIQLVGSGILHLDEVEVYGFDEQARYEGNIASAKTVSSLNGTLDTGAHRPRARGAIVALTRGYDDLQDYDTLIARNRAIFKTINSKVTDKYPLILWHEGNIPPYHQKYISERSGEQEIEFVDIADKFSLPINAHTDDFNENWLTGYRLMCAFNTTTIWSLGSGFEYMLRIDKDCILDQITADPFRWAADERLDYGYSALVAENHQLTNRTMPYFISAYLAKTGSSSRVEDLYDHHFPYTNVGIARTAFFCTPDVSSFMQMAVAQPEFLNFRWGDLPLIGVALKMFSKSMQIAAIPGLKYHHGSHHAVIDTTGSPLVIEPPGPEAPEGLNHSYLELVENARRMALQGKLAEAERVLLDLAGDRPGIDFLTIALCHIGLQLGRNGLVERLFQTIDKRLTSTDAMVALGKSMAIARGQVQIGDVLVGRHDTVDRFYEAYFGSSENKCVIQVGANDGVMCDPLRRFFADIERNDINAVLIEPIPFYYRKLGQLYTGYEHIALYNAACGARRDTLSLYFIDPDVADEMNGDGPANDWAHGQGSFDRDVVLYWIDRNRFRGPGYVQNIEKYQHSITQIDVDMIRLADLDLAKSNENLLIVIDAQGFELQVISGVDWNFPPAFIVFEDDIGGGDSEIAALLKEKGYFHLCGENDKVFFRR